MSRLEADRNNREEERRLVRSLLQGNLPAGEPFDACRAVLAAEPDRDMTFQAMCMMLEGALADPALAIADTQIVVSLLKELARGTVAPEDLL